MDGRVSPTNTVTSNAIGIVRVSVVGDRDEDRLHSPDEQAERIATVCEREDLTLVDTVKALDLSAGKPLDERTDMLQAVAAIESGKASIVVVGYFDRLFRNQAVQREFVARVEQAGGQVVTADLGRVHENNGSAAMWLSSNMLGLVAEYMRRSVGERVRGRRSAPWRTAVCRSR